MKILDFCIKKNDDEELSLSCLSNELGYHRVKRQASEYAVSLSELEECVSGGTTEQEVELHLLADAINTYLGTLSKEARTTFAGQYYYMDSIKKIAAYHNISESKVKSMLYHTRQGLKIYLKEEGFEV